MRLALVALLVPAAALASEPRPIAFDPTAARPWFADGPAAAAAADLRLEDWAGAATGFAAVPQGASPRQGRQTGRRSCSPTRSSRRAASTRRRSTSTRWCGSYPLLADYERIFAARAHLAAGRAKEALDRAKQVPPESALDGEARFLRGEAERLAGHSAEAAAEYRSYLEGYPIGWRAPEARFRLAEALDVIGDHDAARAEWRKLYLDAPTGDLGQAGGARASDRRRTFTADELAHRAMALFDAMANAASEARVEEGAGRARARRQARPASPRSTRRRASSRSASAGARRRCSTRPLELVHARQGRGPAGSSRSIRARAAGGKRGSTTRPRRARRRRCSRRSGASTRCTATPTTRASARPRSTTRSRTRRSRPSCSSGCRWRSPPATRAARRCGGSAFHAWRKGDLDGAKRFLQQELALLPREEGWWEAGRTLYWLGRVADKQGDAAAAVDLYRRAAREYPLSYYALQSLNRLREKWPHKADALVVELHRAPSGDDDAWKFRPRPLFGEAAFKRGVELARLGLGVEAKRELALGRHRGAEEEGADRARRRARGALVAGGGALRSRRRVRAVALHPAPHPDGVRARVAGRRQSQALALELSARLPRPHREARGAQRAAGDAASSPSCARSRASTR